MFLHYWLLNPVVYSVRWHIAKYEPVHIHWHVYLVWDLKSDIHNSPSSVHDHIPWYCVNTGPLHPIQPVQIPFSSTQYIWTPLNCTLFLQYILVRLKVQFKVNWPLCLECLSLGFADSLHELSGHRCYLVSIVCWLSHYHGAILTCKLLFTICMQYKVVEEYPGVCIYYHLWAKNSSCPIQFYLWFQLAGSSHSRSTSKAHNSATTTSITADSVMQYIVSVSLSYMFPTVPPRSIMWYPILWKHRQQCPGLCLTAHPWQ
jgi:hypothetical protein